MKSRMNLPEALILALADNITQAKLRTICYRLQELDRRGRPYDGTTGKQISWLDYVQYGTSGIRFSKIAQVFE